MSVGFGGASASGGFGAADGLSAPAHGLGFGSTVIHGGGSSASTGFEAPSVCAAQAAAAGPSVCATQAAAPSPLPPLPHYIDHLTRRRPHWPQCSDRRLVTCDRVKADIMRSCDYIAHARAFGMRWLKQQLRQRQQRPQPQPFPLRLTRALYAAPEGAGDARACVRVTAAARARVRCNDIARVAMGLFTKCQYDPGERDRCRWGESIIARVHNGYCKAVQVRHCAVCDILQRLT